MPDPEWTWDEFFGYCRRCVAAGAKWAVAEDPTGGEVSVVAEQLGATGEHPEPIRDALAFVRDWAAMGLAPDADMHWWGGTLFYSGRVPFLFMQTGHPYVWFSQNGIRPFQWGIAPYPRLRRSDPHLPHWYYVAAALRGSAPDPLGAFRALAAMFTAGPGCVAVRGRLRGGEG